MLGQWQQRASRPVEALSLAAFRIFFGILTFVSSARFLREGWIEPFFGEPEFFFRYWGFQWVPVPSPDMATGIFIAMMLCSVLIALGWFYRWVMPVFFVLFTWIELSDITNYLNHYYLVSLLSFLMIWLPANRVLSLDAALGKTSGSSIPVGYLWLLRWQVGLVYFYAAIAKLQGDWLLHGQPLNIWLMAQSDFPLLGPLFTEYSIALGMSWLGFLNDLLMVPALLWKKTRIWAYSIAVFFHLMTGALFNIGMFPYIMIVSALIFFPADWPRKWLPVTAASSGSDSPIPIGKVPWIAIGVFCLIQGLLPLRSVVATGPVIWHECGMRFAWKVKVREKNGSLAYRVESPNLGKKVVNPEDYLTRRQAREMATQPDLILQAAHHIGADYERQGYTDVRVFADSFVSLNGRRERRLIRPDRNLMEESDGLFCPDWIEAAPAEPPPELSFQQTRRFKRRR